MFKISEESYLRIRALAHAIDSQLEKADSEDSVEAENALMLSEMLIEELNKVDDAR